MQKSDIAKFLNISQKSVYVLNTNIKEKTISKHKKNLKNIKCNIKRAAVALTRKNERITSKKF